MYVLSRRHKFVHIFKKCIDEEKLTLFQIIQKYHSLNHSHSMKHFFIYRMVLLGICASQVVPW